MDFLFETKPSGNPGANRSKKGAQLFLKTSKADDAKDVFTDTNVT
jgi:hypothetical protein